MIITAYNGNNSIVLADGVLSGKITTGVNEFENFTFSILPNCAAYDEIQPLLTHIKVEDSGEMFFGRVLMTTPKMASNGLIQQDIVCEGRMAYLCDSIQPYVPERQYSGDENRNGLQEFIDVVLENHNAQVENYKKIYRGNVTLTTYATSEGVYKGLNRESTWEALKTKLLDVFGGEMRVRESNGTLYLDYAESLGTLRSTKIQVTKNMIQAEKTIDPSDVVSRLIPLGAKITVETYDADGNITEKETEERVTIAEVNNDIEYLESQTAVDLFGLQYKTVIWDDIHDPQILKTRGTNYLAEQNKAIATYKVSAVDLSYIGEAIDKFSLYDIFPVENEYIGFNDELEVIRKAIDIYNPYNPELTFGTKEISLSALNNDVFGNIQSIGQEISINETNTKNDIKDVQDRIVTSSSEIRQDVNTIVAQIQETTVTKTIYDEFSETVRNILQMDASGTSMIFQTITEEIQRVDDAQNTNYSSILKYIRFEDGTITIGEQDNPITLTLENDILAFKQNGVIVAYFSNNRFHVVDGEFENSLRIGKFAFLPRANGSLNFQKVGG